MKLIAYGLPAAIDYGSEGMGYRELFGNAQNGLLNLFHGHSVPGEPGVCYLPTRWSPAVLNVMRKMLIIDPGLRFSKVYEKYGKLYLEFAASTDSTEELISELTDLVYNVQNRIDTVTHGLVNEHLLFGYKSNIKDEQWLLTKNVLHTAP